MGHKKMLDGMIHDGLWDVYNNYHMGNAAELCAAECNIPRDRQDDFCRLSYERALNAQKEGLFDAEIVPVEIPQKKGDPLLFAADEEPQRVKFDKITQLKPVFDKNGTVTAANASSINDGAAAVVVLAQDIAEKLNIQPMARLVAQASFAKKPEWFTTAPADVINKILKKAQKSIDDIDLFEINEAFSVVSLAVNDILGLSVDKVNVHGGAVALGHPIGASGTRILVTLLHAMEKYHKKSGLAALCIGGGEASAVIVEK
jgi:acetyl-CoA C-acetyltransferase